MIMTQQQTENAAKWLHTKNFIEIEPFRRLLFVVSHENNNRWLNDGLYYCISELPDRTYSLLSHAHKSHNTIKMLNDACIIV